MKQIIPLFLFILLTSSSYSQESKKTRGFQSSWEIGGGFTVLENKVGYLKVDFINGYKFNPTYSLRVGIGARYAPVDKEKDKHWGRPGNNTWLVLPLYADFRANLGYTRFEKVYPYVQTKLGFAMLGVVFNQSIGLGLKNTPITIGLSGEIIRLVSEIETTGRCALIGLNLGVTF